MTPERGSRAGAARRRTQTGGSLCPSPAQFSLHHSPPDPGSARRAGSPSRAPDPSLWRKVNRGQGKKKNTNQLFQATQTSDAPWWPVYLTMTIQIYVSQEQKISLK